MYHGRFLIVHYEAVQITALHFIDYAIISEKQQNMSSYIVIHLMGFYNIKGAII